ncbi:Flp pilus assembly protein TadG [Haloactinopolyspora alba]|uniref:Flp pilus assembly protein TadG n=1 Tax=Haloactinopolyspora alba TaxID=648780 RepID=A0A2P8DVW9_9ACTN|nr:TadE/TadG family type IV pilus assembly protein [Haloactinopolyspora alba]PSL01383.1 Flp pilus assembly protein TadG [Haloactinopolyspora alba]
MTRRRPHDQRGSATTELAVVAPGLLMIIALLVMGGRITIAGGSVEHAAAEAARAASLARSASEAVADGGAAAKRSLTQQGLSCVGSPSITIDARQFARPPGEPATVTATVTCEVRLSDLAIPAVPGSRSITETVRSPIDTYRMRR